MSKDKKKEPTQGKELSEWQKRNQEYLQKKAEEEAKRAEEEVYEKEEQVSESSESDQELSEWQKQNHEYLSKKAEEKSTSSEKVDEESEKSEEKDSDTSDETSNEEKDSKETPQEDSKSQEQVEDEKADTEPKKGKKVKAKNKDPKPPIPSIHIWRAVTILVPSFIIFFLSIYLLSPLATMKHIEVTGTVQTSADKVKEASGIRDSDYTISLFLNKDKYADKVKSNHWIESAKITYQFPIHFTIEVKEFEIIAYYVSGDSHYPILSSGSVESTAVNADNLPEKYISVLFNDEEQIKSLISQLNDVSPEIKQEIEKIELAPSKVTSNLLKITMYDTDEILVPLSELGKKLPYYSKIKPQLTVPSGIDMEVGIYSYSLVDKALDDERIKAKEEEKKKQEEEKKKQTEQGSQGQTTQTTQTTQGH